MFKDTSTVEMDAALNPSNSMDMHDRSKKRHKRSEPTGSGLVIPPGRGKLRAITEMPLDMVYEVRIH